MIYWRGYFTVDVDHLDVRGGGQALHLADEDGGHHQHGRQVHTQGSLEEEGLEEGGSKGDCYQKEGREVSGHHLACYLPLHDNKRTETILTFFKRFCAQIPIGNIEDRHV